MMLNSPSKDDGKERIKRSGAIDDCNNTGANFTFPEIFDLLPITTSRVDTATPKLVELLTKESKDTFGRQVPGRVETLVWCYSYTYHGLVVRTIPLHGDVQTVIQNSLRLLLL